MRWADQDLRYIRPIKWLVALFGQEVIPFSIANVQSNNWSMGHRFLGSRIELTEPVNYEKDMLAQYVVVDPQIRKNNHSFTIEKT